MQVRRVQFNGKLTPSSVPSGLNFSARLNYLLDTNTVSYLMEGRAAIIGRVQDASGLVLVAISTITLAELRYALRTIPASRKKARSLTNFERILDSDVDVRPFTNAAAEVYSEAGATLKEAGIAFSFEDLAIASIAIAENETLASNDGFFEHVERLCGLRFEHWGAVGSETPRL